MPKPSPAWLSWALRKPTSVTLKIPTGSAGGRSLFAEFFDRMDDYHATRDFPAVKGPSYLGVHLRFGTVSIRKLCATAQQRVIAGSEGARVWLSELIWRDFYVKFWPISPVWCKAALKPEYDAIAWEHGKHAKALFTAWCEGRTGYPIVDAAMDADQPDWLHAQPPAYGGGEFFDQRPRALTGAGVRRILRKSLTILTCLPTTAAGNGPPAAAAMRSPIFVSSTPSAKANV